MDDAWAQAFALAEGKADDDEKDGSLNSTRRHGLYSNTTIGATTVSVASHPQQLQQQQPMVPTTTRSRNDIELRVVSYLPPMTVDQEPFYQLQGPLLVAHFSPDQMILLKPSCQMYTPTSSIVNGKRRQQQQHCSVCQNPPAWHLMTAVVHQKNPTAVPSVRRPPYASTTTRFVSSCENPALTARLLYVAVRNLRCSLRAAQPASKPSDSIVETFRDAVDRLLTITTTDDVFAKTDIRTSKKRQKRKRSVDQEERRSILRLDEKLVEACTQVQEILPRFPGGNSDNDDQKSLVWTLRIIMACDAIYYRLYYADLTSAVPFVIPHPVQYFNGWEQDEANDNVVPMTKKPELDQNAPGLMEDPKVLPPAQERTLAVSHALERLHGLRMQESRILFSRLVGPMPDWSLLRDWQDSCRDFLCHLYAYATLSTESLQILKDRLQGHVAVEIGAGTGYLSHLIGNVTPYDCHPAGSGVVDNEYHAATPPFTNVKVGGPRDIDAACSALILCYPPVDNDMAYEALEAFLKASSNKKKRSRQASNLPDKPLLFVHIGEFRGLTGTPRFESLLVEKLSCYDRLPCLSWGSDAAEISFWEPRSALARDNARRKMEQLVSCGCCKNRPATIRFRYARTYCYCSIECAKLDETTLRSIVPPCFAHLLMFRTSATKESQHWEFLRVGPA